MRWVVGLLLVCAAILKAVQLVTQPASTLMMPLGHWLLPMQIGVELGIGLFVLTGLYWRQLRWIALLLFSLFSAYSLYLIIGGAESCGCFGPIKVHPWWTFMLDAAVVFGLLFSARRDQELKVGANTGVPRLAPFSASRRNVIAFIVGASTISTVLLGWYAIRQTTSAEGLLPMAGDLVILEPEQWVGKPLPIADAIDLDLSNGKWTVLLHRHDCPACQVQVPRYDQLGSRGQKVALVEVPPYGDSEEHTSSCQVGRLADDREWFVQTPVEIQLIDGVVTASKTNDH